MYNGIYLNKSLCVSVNLNKEIKFHFQFSISDLFPNICFRFYNPTLKLYINIIYTTHTYWLKTSLGYLNLIKNVKNTVIFLARKVFIYVNFSIPF